VLAEQKAQGAMSPDRAYAPDALCCLGKIELDAGRPASAIAYLEQSVALQNREVPFELPDAEFTLARALRLARRDPPRARTLAEKARHSLEALPGQQDQVASIDAWLADPTAAR
jgi:hypothetical protein